MTATELATKTTTAAATTPEIAPRFTPEQIAASHLNNVQSIPDLSNATKHFMPINVEYWTPQTEGEEKKVYIAGINMQEVPDMETGEIKTLECVMMLERQDNSLVRFISASKVLVGHVRDAIHRGEIIPMSTLTPVSIKFLGQKKNKSNAKLSNRWQIIPVIVAQQ